MSDNESSIRAELAQIKIQDLLMIAGAHFQFHEDADPEVVKRISLRTAIARELTRHDEFYAQFKTPMPSMPEDPLWVIGQGDTEQFVKLNARYPGIVAYFQWARAVPAARHFWPYIEKLKIWAVLEKTLLSALNEKVVIADWELIRMNAMEYVRQTYAGQEDLPEDLRSSVHAELDEGESMALLNHGVGLVLGQQS